MRAVVVAVLALCSQPASAQDGKLPPWPAPNDFAAAVEWQIANVELAPRDIVSMNIDAVVAMDRETLSRQGDLGRAWFSRDVLSQVEADKLSGRSALMYYEADCATKRARFLATSVYSGTGRTGTDDSNNTAGVWAYIRPGSTGEAMAAAICESRFYFSEAELQKMVDGFPGAE